MVFLPRTYKLNHRLQESPEIVNQRQKHQLKLGKKRVAMLKANNAKKEFWNNYTIAAGMQGIDIQLMQVKSDQIII